ncbi:MAG: GAF domain-containing protein [Chloroflexi bacterium]|nr:GAF domain-containing protein [Chloroflexota bacterium]
MAGETILIVDDEAEGRTALVALLARTGGYVCIAAANLSEARVHCTTAAPHLVIVKDQLGREHGLDLLTDCGPRIPLLLITARPTIELMSAALAAGVRDVLIQPMAAERIQAAVDRALRMAQTLRERDQLRDQIDRQNQEFNALYTVSKKVSALLDTEEILTLVVSAAVHLTGAEEGALMLPDSTTGELYLRAHYNLSDDAIQNLRVKVTDALMSRVITGGRPIMLSGGEALKARTTLPVKSILSVPLFVGERVTGVLTVGRRAASQPFSEHHVHLLSTLADSAAIAIENARLYWQADSERAKLDTILREIEDAVIVTDADLRLLLLNNAARSAFNLTDAALGQPLAEAIPLKAVIDLFDQRKLRSQAWRADIVLADGRTLQGQLSVLSGIGYGAVLHDITRLKELDKIKSEFVSIVSHDLRTPLTAIRGYVELLPRVGPLNEQQREFVARVEYSMTNIVSLISDLLDIGRIEAGVDWEMQPLPLDMMIRDTVQELQSEAARSQHALTLEVVDLPPVRGNARRLRQVVNNLVSNALKYTPAGGRITVAARGDGDFVFLHVRDTGIGIALEDQRHIFEKFYRVRSEATEHIQGSGLGLSIVKAIVEKHSGRVWVESEPGQGSTFTVVLPKYSKSDD